MEMLLKECQKFLQNMDHDINLQVSLKFCVRVLTSHLILYLMSDNYTSAAKSTVEKAYTCTTTSFQFFWQQLAIQVSLIFLFSFGNIISF